MLDRYEVYSPKRKKKRNALVARIVKIFLAVVFFYLLVTQFFLSSMSIESVSMYPGMEKGERVFTSPIPFGIFLPFGSTRLTGIGKPERGDLVVIELPYVGKQNSFAAFFEPVLNLVTFQQMSFYSDHSGQRVHTKNIKRIIAIPGDTIKIEGFIAYIKPRQSENYIKEDLLVKRAYTPLVKSDYFPEGWNPGLPFSGKMEEMTLRDNEYFVLGDNRTESNDSRSWGPVQFSRIREKVILRYWPFTKIAGY